MFRNCLHSSFDKAIRRAPVTSNSLLYDPQTGRVEVTWVFAEELLAYLFLLFESVARVCSLGKEPRRLTQDCDHAGLQL